MSTSPPNPNAQLAKLEPKNPDPDSGCGKTAPKQAPKKTEPKILDPAYGRSTRFKTGDRGAEKRGIAPQSCIPAPNQRLLRSGIRARGPFRHFTRKFRKARHTRVWRKQWQHEKRVNFQIPQSFLGGIANQSVGQNSADR